MKKAVILLSIFLISAINYSYSQPNIEFEGGDTHDWGIVKPDDSPLKIKVKILNNSPDTVRIESVKPACGCTTAPLDKKVIEPGGISTLDISLNIGNFTGKINKNIRIKYNNEKQPYKVYYLKANIFRPIFFNPKYFNYGKIETNTMTDQSIKLRNNTDKDIKITKIEGMKDYLRLNISEGAVIPAKGVLKVIATVKVREKGHFNFTLIFHSDYPGSSKINISGWGKCKPNNKQEKK